MQCQLIALHQIVPFLLIYLFLGTFCDDTTSTNLIEIVQILRRILLQLRIILDGFKRFNRSLLQTYIIIIGGCDNGQLAACIDHTLAHARCKVYRLLLYPSQRSTGILIVFVEILVSRDTLTKSHLLDIRNQQLYLVIRKHGNAVQLTVSLLIAHLGQTDEGHVVQCLCTSVVVVFSQVKCLLGIVPSGVKIPIMERIGDVVQLIHLLSMRRRTG